MKNRRERAKRVRQRKVAALAAYSRQHTVKHGMISNVENLYQVPWNTITNKLTRFTVGPNMAGKYYIKDKNGNLKPFVCSWKIPKDGFKQPKIIHDIFPNHVFRPKGQAWFMEQLVQHKLAKWEKKNPCPVKENQNPPDIFEQEYLVPWKAKRELALERIRDFVVSMYDKLSLTGRFKQSDDKFVEEQIANIKDINGEGHKINDLCPKKSKLLKKAQDETDKVKAKRTNLICTNLRDHQRKRGRIILPKAA